MATVYDGKLHVHYGQAYVFSGKDGDTGEMDSCFRGQSNGLLGAGQAGMLYRVRVAYSAAARDEVDGVGPALQSSATCSPSAALV